MGASRNIAALVLMAVALVTATAGTAQPVPGPPKPADGPPSPFTFTFAYTVDLLDDAAGGAQTGGDYVHLLKLSVAYDGAKAGHPGLTGLVSVIDENGADFTGQKVGGIQAVSSLEAQPQATRLYEAWLQQEVGRGGVKVGLVDLNSTFDVQETAALFLNASQGIGADIGDTGTNGPSDYPTPAPAVTLFYHPAAGWTAQLGVFDGVAGNPAHRSAFVGVDFDGALIIGQVEKRFGDVARMEVGAWTYTSAFPSLDQFDALGRPLQVHGNAGVYGLVEGRLMPKPGDSDGGLSGWIRVGVANGHINEVQNYVGAGLVYTGLIAGRDKDQFGIAIARAGLGPGARYVGMLGGRDIGPAETDVEATYRYTVNDWLNVQPDVQYVIDPHGDRGVQSALVLGLRLAFTYSK